jgi:Protein of unknown function (DUF2384)
MAIAKKSALSSRGKKLLREKESAQPLKTVASPRSKTKGSDAVEEIFGCDYDALRDYIVGYRDDLNSRVQPAFEMLSSFLGTNKQQTLNLLGWQRLKTSFDCDALDRALSVLSIHARVYPYLGDKTKDWFHRPNKHLANNTPLELVRFAVGPQWVHQLLDSVDAGHYL